MRKCIILFSLLILAIFILKISTASSENANTNDLVILSNDTEIVKN